MDGDELSVSELCVTVLDTVGHFHRNEFFHRSTPHVFLMSHLRQHVEGFLHRPSCAHHAHLSLPELRTEGRRTTTLARRRAARAR